MWSLMYNLGHVCVFVGFEFFFLICLGFFVHFGGGEELGREEEKEWGRWMEHGMMAWGSVSEAVYTTYL